MELIDQLIEKEKALLSNDVRSSAEKLKSFISEDFIEIGASGNVFGLKEVLEWLPENKSWSAKVSDFRFRFISDGIVQLIYKASIKHNEKEEGEYSLRTSTWKKEFGTWKIVFHQGTKISPY